MPLIGMNLEWVQVRLCQAQAWIKCIKVHEALGMSLVWNLIRGTGGKEKEERKDDYACQFRLHALREGSLTSKLARA
eukprot:1143266-Pelagomonas_calceolata.AAC.2